MHLIKKIYKSDRFDYLIWFAYLSLGLVGIFSHEIWMDEAHHWLVIRDVKNFSEFVRVEAIDGQPFIWPILLFFVQSISDEVIAFQLFHFCIGATTALLFLRNAPFNKNIKYLFVLSYPMLFEYLIISRNYSLSLLVLFIYLIYFRKKGILAKAIILGLLANTHFFAAILASTILLYEVNPKISDLTSINPSKAKAYAIFSGFLFLLFLQLKNSLDHAVLEQYNTWTLFERCKRLVLLHFRSFIVIPDFTSIHFWGSVLPFKVSKAFGLLSIPIFLFPLMFFRSVKIKWLFYAFIVAISVFLFSIHQPIANRYSCFIFIAFMVFYWLQKEDFSFEYDRRSRFSELVIILSLFIQMISGITSVYFDYRFPFSQGKNVASFIEENGYSEWPIIIHPYSSAPAISAYLGKPYYSLLTNSTASFCRWETNPFMISNEEFYRRLTSYLGESKQSVLLIKNTYKRYDTEIEKQIIENGYYENEVMRIDSIHTFEPAVVSNEEYIIYEVIYKNKGID